MKKVEETPPRKLGSNSQPTPTYTAVTPIGTENPKNEGWYELVNSEYILTTDETIDEEKTYYQRS